MKWKWAMYGYGIGFVYGLPAYFFHLPSAFDIIVLLGGNISGTLIGGEVIAINNERVYDFVFIAKEMVYTGVLGGIIGGVVSLFYGKDK
jgi:hypothetical protein